MLRFMFDTSQLDPPEHIRRLSRLEYERMVELGMFEDERLELLRGMLVVMSPQGAPHAVITAWFHKCLVRGLDDTYDIRSHSAFAASDDSEPEPDVSVSLRGPELFAHPSTSLLLIEVSESSIRKDRRIKAPLYAEANVPEYWIVDISGSELRVEVHTDPTPIGYRQVAILRDGDVLRPAGLAGLAIPVADIPWKR
jgi:Uma2 family endonuclease